MDVFDYDDYRAFLSDWLAAHPRVSHRAFMRRMGSRDPSVLKRILSGRRGVSAAQLEPMIAALELDRDAAACFRLLVRHAHARTAAERAEAERELAGLRAVQAARLLADPRAYASWCRVAVRELAACRGFVPDPERVAATFDPPIPGADAADALEHLGASREAVARTTPARVRHREVFGYYRGIHERTAQALDRLERDPDEVERSLFLGLTLAVPEALVPRLRERLLEVQRELLGLAEQGAADRGLVLQVNLQLFALTRPVADATDGVADATGGVADATRSRT